MQTILLGDDTRVRLLTRGALDEEDLEKIGRRSGSQSREGPPGSVTSYAWLYTGLDDAAPYNVFHWSLTHEDCWIDTHLASFEGVFVGDATGPNARLEQRSNGRIVHAGCNSHARREFVAAEKTHPTEAAKALSYYGLLYDIEERGKLLDEAGLLRLRQSEAVRVWQAFEKWADSPSLKSVLPKSILPDHWAAAHPSLVCGERREEREDVAESSRIRRIERRLAQREKRRAEMQARQAQQPPTT